MKINKIIAPIIVTIILVTYYSLAIFGILRVPESLILKVIGTIIGLILIGVSINSLIQRIKEIRSGEYDDLSKY